MRKGAALLTLDHGARVQSAISQPGRTMAISAVDTQLEKVLNGGELVYKCSNHQKQIKALYLDGIHGFSAHLWINM